MLSHDAGNTSAEAAAGGVVMNFLAADPSIAGSFEDGIRAKRWVARTLRHPDTVILDTESVDLGAAICEIAVINTLSARYCSTH